MKVPITEILKSNIFDYILVTGDITVVTPPATQVPFKNWWKNNAWCWGFRFSHVNVQSSRV